MSPTMLYGIDVSHHQDPKRLAWDDFVGRVDFVIARACYGAGLRDRHAVEHVRRGRAIGAQVGLYLFFRPIHPVEKQFDLFRAVADAVHLGAGDIVPVVDIEDDPFPHMTPVRKHWNGPVLELVQLLDDWCGAKCMPYLNAGDWADMGSPEWVCDPERPLWIANYTTAPEPKTPRARAWDLWQHRVSVFEPNGAGGLDADPKRRMLDQNRATALPLIRVRLDPSCVAVTPEDQDDAGLDDLRDEVAARQFPWFELIDFRREA